MPSAAQHCLCSLCRHPWCFDLAVQVVELRPVELAADMIDQGLRWGGMNAGSSASCCSAVEAAAKDTACRW